MLEELKRCFIALDLPREVINEIKRIQKLINEKIIFIEIFSDDKKVSVTGKLTETENLHLTLKFLGEISDEKIKEVRDKLREVEFNSFNAELGDVGVFSKRIPKIIWIEMKGRVFELQKEIDKVLKGLFDFEFRFMSHITIARVKYVKNKKGFNEYLKSVRPKALKFNVNKFFLKESELFLEGPVYNEIEKYNLES